MKIKIIQNIKAILLAFVLTLGISYVSAQVWSDPISYPPTGNVPAPINVGKLPQTKEGPLTSLHLFTPDFTFNPQTSPTAGQVLMAEDSTGKAKWGSLPPPPSMTFLDTPIKILDTYNNILNTSGGLFNLASYGFNLNAKYVLLLMTDYSDPVHLGSSTQIRPRQFWFPVMNGKINVSSLYIPDFYDTIVSIIAYI